jgi:hypothetical protein
MTATYIDANSFKVDGDLTKSFRKGRKVRCDCDTDGIKYRQVASSSYASGETTVTLSTGEALTANLQSVLRASNNAQRLRGDFSNVSQYVDEGALEGNDEAWIGEFESHEFFQAYNTTVTDVNTTNPVPWDVEDFKDPAYTHSVSSNPERITVTKNGLYKITYQINIETTDNSGCNPRTVCRKNGSTEIPISASYSYARNTTDDKCGNSTHFLARLEANDYIEIMGGQGGGTGTANTIPNESMVLIELIK